ncbi:MAG: MFS transporter, partial [Nitrososphaeraceae archaeon]
ASSLTSFSLLLRKNIHTRLISIQFSLPHISTESFDTSKSQEISFAAWKSVVILTGTTLLILFMHTALSPAIPIIANQFNVDQSLAAWVMSIYMISGAVMTIIIGNFSDALGAKKMLVMMMVVYTVATILAGFSQDIYTLLAIRAIQGIAIANTPIALKIIRDQFPKGKFSIGQSIVTSAYSAGMALGVVFGPILVAETGWQTIFFICIPISALLLFFCWRSLPIDETAKIGHVEQTVKETSSDKPKSARRLNLDVKGIVTMAVAMVSFLIAITNSGKLPDNIIGFVIPLIIGAISLILFLRVEKKAKNPLVPLKLLLQPAIFAGNISMLMFGIVQYIIITAIPQLGAAPPGSGLGLEPDAVGLLQLPLSLAVLVFGPLFGVMLAKRHSLNTKLLIPAMLILSVSFLLVTLFHSTASDVAGSLFLFGIGAALLPVTLINIIISLTPRQLTGISGASTSDMRIIGGAIGPVIATVIITSILVSVEVDGVVGEYPSPSAFNLVLLVGLAMAVASTILVSLMRRKAVKALSMQPSMQA